MRTRREFQADLQNLYASVRIRSAPLHTVFMRPDHIHEVVRILRKEILQWPVPAIGHYVETPFTVLISCILSLRTQDKTTNAASERLFAIAATPEKMLATPVGIIERVIYPVSFYRVKATTLHAISEQLLTRYKGRVPSRMEDLLELPGGRTQDGEHRYHAWL